MKRTVLPSVALLLSTACGAAIEGELSIDGSTAAIAGCESTTPKGYDGVDLLVSDGRIVRLMADGTDISEVVFFPAGANVGPRLGSCAIGTIETSGTRVNEVVALDGTAKIDCTTTYVTDEGTEVPIAVVGDITFSTCH